MDNLSDFEINRMHVICNESVELSVRKYVQTRDESGDESFRINYSVLELEIFRIIVIDLIELFSMNQNLKFQNIGIDSVNH